MSGLPLYDSWSCPFCGGVAALETHGHVICDSRTCLCGAIALAAPVVDSDEIVDDAIGIFNVKIRQQSRGFDALLLEDLRQTGVEVREGKRVKLGEGVWGAYTSLWFRKSPSFKSE